MTVPGGQKEERCLLGWAPASGPVAADRRHGLGCQRGWGARDDQPEDPNGRGAPYVLGAGLPAGREGHGEVQGAVGRHQPLLLQDGVQPVRRDAPLPLLYRLQTEQRGLSSGFATAGRLRTNLGGCAASHHSTGSPNHEEFQAWSTRFAKGTHSEV